MLLGYQGWGAEASMSRTNHRLLRPLHSDRNDRFRRTTASLCLLVSHDSQLDERQVVPRQNHGAHHMCVDPEADAVDEWAGVDVDRGLVVSADADGAR